MCAKTTPEVPSVQETMPGFDDAVADRARGLVAAAADDGRARPQVR